MAEEIRIDLKSTADTSGFDKLGAASKSASAGLGASAKASKELAGELGRSVEVGGATVGLFQNIATATQGGASGLAAAARAGLGFGQMLKGLLAGAGPVGVVLAGVGVAAGALVAALSKPKGSVNDLAAAFKAAKESADKFDQAKFDGIRTTMAELRTELSETLKEFDSIAEAHEKIAKAADDTARAEIEAAKSGNRVTDQQADAALKRIDARAASRGIKNASDRTEFEESEVNRQLARAKSYAEQPEAEMDYYRSEADKIRGRQSAARQTMAEYNAAAREAYGFTNSFGVPLMEAGAVGVSAETARAFEAAKQRYHSAGIAARSAQEASAGDFSKGSGRNAEESYADFVADSLKKAEEVWKAANSGVSELAKQSKELAEKMAREKETRAEIDRINSESKRRQEALDDKLTPSQSAKERARLAGLNSDQLRTMIANGDQFSSPALLQERLNQINAANPGAKPLTYSLPIGGVQGAAAPQQSSAGVLQLGGGALPSDSDKSGIKGITKGLDKAAKAADGAGDMKEAQAASEKLATSVQEMVANVSALSAAQATGFGETASTTSAILEKVVEIASVVSSHSAQISQLRAQAAAVRVRKS